MENRSAGFGLTGMGAIVAIVVLALRGPADTPSPSVVAVAVDSVRPRLSATPYTSPNETIAAYDRGRRLVSGYFGVPWSDLTRVGADAHGGRTGIPLRILIATVPDPFDSHLDWWYDAALDAVRRAMGTAGFVPQSFSLPARGDSLVVDIDGVRGKVSAHDFHPGVLLFRAKDADRPELILVYLVPEIPTAGVHMYAFRAAIAERKRLISDAPGVLEVAPREQAQLSVLGPTFSGSSPSLRVLLGRALAEETPGAKALRAIRVVSGSASAFGNLKLLRDPTRVAVPSRESGSTSVDSVPRIHFSATVNPDEALDSLFSEILVGLKVKDHQVAVLSESGTAYGEGRAGGTDTSRSGDGARFLTVPFPLNIASLRSEFERSPEVLDGAPKLPRLSDAPRTRLSLDDASRPRESPTITSRLAVPSLDVELANILHTLNEHDIRVVVIKATDVRDKLMLAREVRRSLRDVVLVIYESHVLLRRPEFSDALRGALILSSYPLSLENQFWTTSHRDTLQVTVRLNDLLAFPNDASVGTYNAVLELAGLPDRRIEYSLHDDSGPGSSDEQYNLPPVWLSAVGREAFYPIRAFVPPVQWREYLGGEMPPPQGSARQRLHEHANAEWDASNAIVVLMPALVLTALLVMYLVGEDRLRRSGFLYPRALERPRSATEALYLGLFLLSLVATYLPFAVAVDARRIIASLDAYVDGSLSWVMIVVLVLSLSVVVFGALLLVNGLSGILSATLRDAVQTRSRASGRPSSGPSGNAAGATTTPTEDGGSLLDFLRSSREMPTPSGAGAAVAAQPAKEDFAQATVRTERVWLTVSGIGAITLASLTFVVATLWYTGHLVSFSMQAGREGALSVYRALHLTSGVSPILPLVLLGAGFAIWTWWQLQQARHFAHPDDFENALHHLASASQPSPIWRRVYRAIVDARRGLAWFAPGLGVVGLVIAIAVGIVFAWDRYVPSLEMLAEVSPGGAEIWFDRALWTGLLGLVVSSAWAIYRLVRTWNGIERFLDAIVGTPIASAFARLPLDLARLTDLGFLGYRRDSQSDGIYADELWRYATNDVQQADQVLQGLRTPAPEAAPATTEGAALTPSPAVVRTTEATVAERNNAAIVTHLGAIGTEATRDAKGIQRALAGAHAAWGVARTRPNPVNEAPIEERWIAPLVARSLRSVEEYLAFEILLYVEAYLSNLRRLGFFLFASLLILVIVSAQYPYQPHSIVSLAGVVLMAATVVAVFMVMIRMSRNEALSRIARTPPGKVTWDTTFILNLITFGVVPLLALLTSEFPEVRSFLFSWADPLVRAVTRN